MIGPVPDFGGLLAQVSPHMSTDDTLPVLYGVHFQADARYLYATATDRYTLAVARRPLENGAAKPWQAFVCADDLKTVRAFTKLARRKPLSLDLRDGEDGPRLALAAGRLALDVPSDPRGFPLAKLRQLLTKALGTPPELRRPVQVNPAMLARWGAAAPDHYSPLTMWTSGANGPIVVACGTDFLGIHMPVACKPGTAARLQADVRDAWGDHFGYAPAERRAA